MYPPPTCDTPFTALSKAIEYMHGPRFVYVVMADTDHGISACAMPTMAAAKATLQFMLDNNDDIQYAVRLRGIGHITADDYLNGVVTDEPGVMNWYSIDAQEVDFSVGGDQ